MEEDNRPKALTRERRTPITDAGSALNVAWEFFVELISDLAAEDPGRDRGSLADPESYFATEIFATAWDDPQTSGEEAAEKIGLSGDGTRDADAAPFALLQAMMTVVAFSVQAMRAETEGNHEAAWTFASDARYWSGILNAAWADKKYERPNPAAELAKKRHAENYALQEDALKYWREKIDPKLSASKAANELVRVVPLSHKKLAEIVSAAKKKIT